MFIIFFLFFFFFFSFVEFSHNLTLFFLFFFFFLGLVRSIGEFSYELKLDGRLVFPPKGVVGKKKGGGEVSEMPCFMVILKNETQSLWD